MVPGAEARVQQLSGVLARSPFYAKIGFSLDSCHEGGACVLLRYDEGNTTAATALHGGAIAATLEAGGAMAAWASTDPDAGNLEGRTLACDVSYIAGALGEDVFGEGRVLRRGKEIVYVDARVVNADGKLLATGNHIYQLRATGTGGDRRDQNPPGSASGEPPSRGPGRTLGGIGALPRQPRDIVDRNTERISSLDGRMPYMANLGFRLVEADYGRCVFRMPCAGAARGEDGGLAGGALLSAVDHAGSLAAWLTMPFGDRELFGSTVNTKVQIFSPRIDGDVLVDARAEGGCGPVFHSVVEIATCAGESVAQGSTIYRIVERASGARRDAGVGA